MTALQDELLEGAATAVAHGGLLVYSTCSLEREENEDRVERFLAEHPDFRVEPPTVDVPMTSDGLLFVSPAHDRQDGAFAARLRRAG